MSSYLIVDLQVTKIKGFPVNPLSFFWFRLEKESAQAHVLGKYERGAVRVVDSRCYRKTVVPRSL